MSEEKNLFSITDTGEGIQIRCEAEPFELIRAFSSLYRSSYVFRGVIKTSIEIAEEEGETGLEEVKHSEYVMPIKTKGNA
jgi:hypothetical protein